jgi:shikimate kinase
MTLKERLKGINLYLVGMMGAGKSSTGLALAEALGYQFFDTDAVLEAAAGQTIPEIFAQQGETAFRQLETEVLAELSAYKHLVIATGGGIVLRKENWSYLHHGIVVWLDVPTVVLKQRLAGDMGRPLLQVSAWEDRVEQLHQQREHLYAQADVQVTVTEGEGIDEIATRTLDLVAARILPTS